MVPIPVDFVMKNSFKQKNQIGQTLIETMVGIFVLVMGITSALGLATFSLHSSTNIVKQLTAMGLAREGIEAIKNMRDTNWLQDTIHPTGCYDFRTNTANNAPCYQNWLNPTAVVNGGYNIGTTGVYRVDFYPNNNNLSAANYYWNLESAGGTPLFNLHPDVTQTQGRGFFWHVLNGNSGADGADAMGTYYYRKIILTKDTTTAPYNQTNLGRLKVQSQVWWTDKNCAKVSDFPGPGKCAIELTLYLTNWKNY